MNVTIMDSEKDVIVSFWDKDGFLISRYYADINSYYDTVDVYKKVVQWRILIHAETFVFNVRHLLWYFTFQEINKCP